MNEEKVLEVFVQVRKTYNLLGEVLELSRQMAESLDREDQTSFHMLLTMRRDPIQELAATRERISDLLREFSREDAERVRAVLNGGPGSGDMEEKMAQQVAVNAGLWEDLYELDRRLNRKIAHGQSVYAQP